MEEVKDLPALVAHAHIFRSALVCPSICAIKYDSAL